MIIITLGPPIVTQIREEISAYPLQKHKVQNFILKVAFSVPLKEKILFP